MTTPAAASWPIAFSGYTGSAGVIGRPLPMDAIRAHFDALDARGTATLTAVAKGVGMPAP